MREKMVKIVMTGEKVPSNTPVCKYCGARNVPLVGKEGEDFCLACWGRKSEEKTKKLLKKAEKSNEEKGK